MPVEPKVVQLPKYVPVRSQSPFRYPGGKSWFVPVIRLWIKSKVRRPHLLVEPFAGGASVGIACALETLIAARWYPRTLCQRIQQIRAHADSFDVQHGDALDLLAANAFGSDTLFFIDPPYTVSAGKKRPGRRLYAHNELDHDALFTLCKSLQGDFVMTYDDDPGVRNMVERHGLTAVLVPMRTNHHQPRFELVVGRDLSWLKQDDLAAGGGG